MRRAHLVAWTALFAAACSEHARDGFAERPAGAAVRFADGRVASAAELEAGRRAYLQYCASCHGVDGDGQGPMASVLRPAPRDLRTGIFKFGTVARQALPSDADLARIVKDGLAGTAMLGWELADEEQEALIAFIKTFPAPPCDVRTRGHDACADERAAYPSFAPSPWLAGRRGARDEEDTRDSVGVPITAPDDPWAGDDRGAIERGKLLYHTSAACTGCHRAYVTGPEQAELAARAGQEPAPLRADPYRGVARSPDDNAFREAVVPPDFTRDVLRSVRPAHALEDLYLRIAVGVGGGLMPGWLDAAAASAATGESAATLVYALAHYVDALRRMRGSAAADALRPDVLAEVR